VTDHPGFGTATSCYRPSVWGGEPAVKHMRVRS
jgi:hypothetical protein